MLNHCQLGTFPRNTVPNLKNEGHYLSITTQSGKSIIDLPRLFVDEVWVDVINIDDTPEAIGADKHIEKNKGKGKEDEPVVKIIPRSHPPILQRLNQNKEEGNYKKFMSLLKELSLNIPLLKSLEQILGYAKFMKYLLKKNRVVTYVDISGLHHYSEIIS